MSKPVMFALAAVLFVGLGIFFLLDDGTAVSAVSREGAATTADAPERLGPADAVGTLRTSAFDKSNAIDADTPGALSIIVVDESDTPVKGATVEFQRARGGFGRGGRGGGMFPSDDTPKPMRTMTTDSEGRVAVDEPVTRSIDIIAKHQDAIGMASFDPNDPQDLGAQKRVVIRPIKNVDVQVVDTNGTPVPGVRVQANLDDPFNRARMARQWTADPDGVARLQVTALDPELYDSEEITLAAQLLGAEAVTEKASLRAAGRTIIRVPNIITVNVVVKAAFGDPLPERLNLTWQIENADGGQGGGRGGMMGMMNNAFGRRDFSGTKTSIAGFKAGAVVRFSLGADDRVTTRATLTLPTETKTADLEIELGKAQPYLTARLIDDVGTPITTGNFSAELAYVGEAPTAPAAPATATATTSVEVRGGPPNARGGRGGGNRPVDVEPDETGLVRIPVDIDRPGTMKFRKSDGGFGPGGGNDAVLATHPFTGTAPGQVQTLPDIRIDRPPVLVAGVVVDAGGVPVPNARVTIDLSEAAVALRQNQNNADNQGGGRGGRGPNRGAFGLFNLSNRSDKEGRFELRAVAGDDVKELPLKVTAQSKGARAEAVSFKPGTTDVKVTVAPTGSLVGKVRMAIPTMKGAISMTAAPSNLMSQSDGAPWMRFVAPGGARARAAKDGSFTLRELKPGNYDIVFAYDGEDVTTISNIEVKGGEPTADPRLADLVIGTEAWIGDVTVTDERGSPLQGASVTFDDGQDNGNGMRRGGGGRMGFGGFRFGRPMRTDSFGHVAPSFVHRVENLTVKVAFDGYREQSFTNPAFPLTVRMNKGATVLVTFALPGGFPPIEGLRNFRLRAQPAMTEEEMRAAMEAMQNGGQGRFQGGNQQTVSLEPGVMSGEIQGLMPGKWSIRASAVMEGRGNSNWIPLGDIVVGENDQRLAFTVTLDATTAELLRQAGRGRGPRGGGQGGGNGGGAGPGTGGAPGTPTDATGAPRGRGRGQGAAGGQGGGNGGNGQPGQRGGRGNRGNGGNGDPQQGGQGNGGG